MSPRMLPEEAVCLVADGATVTVSSSSGLGCPDVVLRALGERFEREGRPRGLTLLHPIAAGDMYGIAGIDHLAQPGLIHRVIAGSYPSGPSSLETPRIWRMIDGNEVEAYNLPSGVIYHMLREAAAHRPGVLTTIGTDTVVDPARAGGKMNERTRDELVTRVELDGREWLYYRAIPVDVAIVRGTTADEDGNVSMEYEGSYLGALDQVLAARANGGVVIAQVKRTVPRGTLSPQSVRLPGALIDAVVVAPGQMQTTQTPYDPAISGEARTPVELLGNVEWGVEKVIARRAAMELRRGELVNLGFGISALAPGILLEEGLDGQVTWVIEQGAVGGLPLTGFQFGCAANAAAFVSSPDQFTLFHGGGFDRGLLSFMEADGDGSVNVSRKRALPHVTAGIGGFIDITGRAPSLVFSGTYTAGGLRVTIDDGRLSIAQEGRSRKLVPAVEQVTFSGPRALETGQRVLYVTERCVLRLKPDGLTVIEIAPGIDLERDVLAQSDTPLRVSHDLRLMDERLFRPEPMRLELEPRPVPTALAEAG